jgi:hypothetical protein
LENGSPFIAGNKLQRSPVATVKKNVEANTDMEVGDVSFSAGINEQSTPIDSNKKGGTLLARRAVEQRARIRGKPLHARSEAEDSAREDIEAQSSEVEGEEIILTMAELTGFT